MRLTARSRQGSRELVNRDIEKELWRINWRAEGYPYCGIYIVAPDNSWPVKVGISQNPTKRLVGLQTACWRKLDIWHYRYCESFAAAKQVEQRCHQMLTDDGKAMLGEWFDIRPDQAIDLVDFAAALCGVEVMSSIPDARIADALADIRVKVSNTVGPTQIDQRPNWCGVRK